MAERKPLVMIGGQPQELPAGDTLLGSGGAPDAEQSPAFTYTGSDVIRIDYASGHHKELTYASGALTRVDHVRSGLPTIRKDFSYNPDGSLSAITQSEVAP